MRLAADPLEDIWAHLPTTRWPVRHERAARGRLHERPGRCGPGADRARAAIGRARGARLAVAPRSWSTASPRRCRRPVDTVARRLLGARLREGLGDAGLAGRRGRGTRSTGSTSTRPLAGATRRTRRRAGAGAAVELADAAVNLAIAYARAAGQHLACAWRRLPGALRTCSTGRRTGPDAQVVLFERLATEGHNLHPCGRTRLGWDVADVLAHDLESPATTIGFVGGPPRPARRRRRRRRAAQRRTRPCRRRRPGYAVQPVHAWQLDRGAAAAATPTWSPTARWCRWTRDAAGRADRRAAHPAAAARRRRPPPVPEGVAGHPGHLDPAHHLGGQHPQRPGVVGAAAPAARRRPGRAPAAAVRRDRRRRRRRPATRDRDLSAILRSGLSGRLAPGEIAVPGARPARPSPGRPGGTVLADCVRPVRARARPATAAGGAGVPRRRTPGCCCRRCCGWPTRYGIGARGAPAELRADLRRRCAAPAGAARLRRPADAPPAAGRGRRRHCALWPGSVDRHRRRGRDAGQARLHRAAGAPRRAGGAAGGARTAWTRTRPGGRCARSSTRPTTSCARSGGGRAAGTTPFLTAPTVPHKALVRMRLAGGGGTSTCRCANPLACDRRRPVPPPVRQVRRAAGPRAPVCAYVYDRVGAAARAAAAVRAGAAGRRRRCCTRSRPTATGRGRRRSPGGGRRSRWPPAASWRWPVARAGGSATRIVVRRAGQDRRRAGRRRSPAGRDRQRGERARAAPARRWSRRAGRVRVALRVNRAGADAARQPPDDRRRRPRSASTRPRWHGAVATGRGPCRRCG